MGSTVRPPFVRDAEDAAGKAGQRFPAWLGFAIIGRLA